MNSASFLKRGPRTCRSQTIWALQTCRLRVSASARRSCGPTAAPPTWALLKAEPEAVRSLVLAHHPLLASAKPLSAALPALPKCLGLRAVCARLFRPRDNAVCAAPALHMDTASPAVVNELPALLPALTELRAAMVRPAPAPGLPLPASTTLCEARLQPATAVPPPPPLTELRFSMLRSRARVRGDPLDTWAPLVATLCETLTGLQRLELTCGALGAPHAFAALTALRALTALTVDVQRCADDEVSGHLAPALAHLGALRALVLLHSRVGQAYTNNEVRNPFTSQA